MQPLTTRPTVLSVVGVVRLFQWMPSDPDIPSPDEGNQTVVPRSAPPPVGVGPRIRMLLLVDSQDARFRTPNNPQGLPPTQENVQALKQMANDPQARQHVR